MGQQHKKITKRRRRSNYLKRKKEELASGTKPRAKAPVTAKKAAATHSTESKKKAERKTEA